MKTLITSLLLMIFTASLLSAQEILKGANAIIITGDFLKDDKLSETTSLLLELGIRIEKEDKEHGSITTSPRSFKNGSVSELILIKDNQVIIRGQWSSNILVSIYGATSNPNEISEITYGGQRGSPKRNAWNEMSALADRITGEKSYVIK